MADETCCLIIAKHVREYHFLPTFITYNLTKYYNEIKYSYFPLIGIIASIKYVGFTIELRKT